MCSNFMYLMHEIAILMQLYEVFYLVREQNFYNLWWIVYWAKIENSIKWNIFFRNNRTWIIFCSILNKYEHLNFLVVKSTSMYKKVWNWQGCCYTNWHMVFYPQYTQSFVVLGSFNYSLHDSLWPKSVNICPKL